MRNEALLQRLTQAQGVAGYEKEVRAMLEEEVRPYACDACRGEDLPLREVSPSHFVACVR